MPSHYGKMKKSKPMKKGKKKMMKKGKKK